MTFDLFTRAALALLACSYAFDASAYKFNQCNMNTDNNSQTMTFVLPLGDFYVPRDVPVGTPIGQAFQLRNADNPQGLSVYCNREGADNPSLDNPVFVSDVVALGTPFVGNLPPIAGRDINGKVFHTSVPGVGIALEFTNPYWGGNPGEFTTPTRLAPFRATNHFLDHEAAGPNLSILGVFVLLIKIGDIPAGPSNIAPDLLFEASMMPAVPRAYTVAVNGTVRQAQCTLSPTDPVSSVPVDLGSWSNTDFTGPGSHTAAVPFAINLQDCVNNSGPDRLGFATAHVTLDGADGSTIVDKDLGLFSLDSAGTARGVGIQVLKGDGLTAVTLGQAFPITRIAPSGNTRMEFSARLYQLPGSSQVTGGKTTGALNFTISYL